jgi:hypothetical protein
VVEQIFCLPGFWEYGGESGREEHRQLPRVLPHITQIALGTVRNNTIPADGEKAEQQEKRKA